MQLIIGTLMLVISFNAENYLSDVSASFMAPPLRDIPKLRFSPRNIFIPYL